MDDFTDMGNYVGFVINLDNLAKLSVTLLGTLAALVGVTLFFYPRDDTLVHMMHALILAIGIHTYEYWS